ncbi:transcriptional regulator [Weissella coleopterorum]|uniref:Aminopyrimidine aminohydrolase n=1 Tax=Weissella coleopterorum TaxID=2714949 RepID=A0A6G8AYZ3_9LACO|nr:TenA family protein [Weissella coleopterorum]QIL50284.1 transcriptional regulator [Weissella coleopterorum]
MKFNQYLLSKSKAKRQTIAGTAFVQALINGTLSQNARNYYVAQDHFYVDKFDAFFQTVTQKLPQTLQAQQPHGNGLEAEAHQALKPDEDLSNISVGDHNLTYLKHIEVAVSQSDPVAGILALLPCTESYHLLAREFSEQAALPFQDWFNYYTSQDYMATTHWLWQTLNTLVPDIGVLSVEQLAAWTKIYQQAYEDEINFWQAVPMTKDN